MAKVTPVLLKAKRNEKTDLTPVYIRIEAENRRRYISLGFSIRESQWNAKQKRVRKSNREYKRWNAAIASKLAKIAKLEARLDADDRPITVDAIKEALEGRGINEDFFSYAERYIAKEEKELRLHTVRTDRSVVAKLRDYVKGPRLPFNRITPGFLEKYDGHLIDIGNQQNTRYLNFTVIRKMIRAAIREGVCRAADDPFVQFVPPKKKDGSAQDLTGEEIDSLIKVDLSQDEDAAMARDMFVFSFFTWGMRFTDVLQLKRSSIINDQVVYQTSKSGKKLSVPIRPECATILSRYEVESEGNTYLFPLLRNRDLSSQDKLVKARVYFNHRVNLWLQRAVERAKISTHVTFHCARHSFAAAAASAGVPIWHLQQSLAHTHPTTTDIYTKKWQPSDLESRVAPAYDQVHS